MRTPITPEVSRTQKVLDYIRAHMPVLPFGACSAKDKSLFTRLREARVAHREACRKARGK